MMLMVLLQMLYLQPRSKTLNINLAHHYTYQILQDSNRPYRPMDRICWLSTIPVVGSLPFPSPMHTQYTHFCSLPGSWIQAEMNMAVGKSPPYMKAQKMIPSLLYSVLREVCSTSQQSSSSKNTLKKFRGPMNLAVKCLWKDGVQSLSLDQPKPFMSW